jgi:hypothetical protein
MDLEPRPPIGLRASIGVLMKVALGLAATEAAAFQAAALVWRARRLRGAPR